LRGPLWMLGLIGVLVSAFVVSPASGFPAPWAALPVLSAAVVIAAGIPGPIGGWELALTNPASRYLGRISYSLYLWHWPVIVVAAALIPDAPAYRYPIAVLAMLGLSIASYHLVEAPGRSWRRGRRVTFDGVRRPAVAAVVCVLVAVGLIGFIPPRDTPAFNTAPANSREPLPAADLATPAPDLAAAITGALSARQFPAEFDPSLAHQGTARTAWGACDGAGPKELASCTFGSRATNAKVAVVIGDSIAMSWLPGVEAALGPAWRVVGITLEACPAADIAVRDTNGRHDTDCDTHHAWATDEATELHPQLVVLSSSEDTLERLADNASGAEAAAEYRAAMRKTIDQLGPSTNRRIVTLSPPPTAGALSQCDTGGTVPADCVRYVSDHWLALAAAEQAAGATTGTSYVDTRLWFCNNTGFCPAFVRSTAVRWDSDHLTDVYARMLGHQLRAVLLPT
jgi:hypothetical protein